MQRYNFNYSWLTKQIELIVVTNITMQFLIYCCFKNKKNDKKGEFFVI